MSKFRTTRNTIITFAWLVVFMTGCSGGSVTDRTPTPSPTAPLPTARPTATLRPTPTFAPATQPAPMEPTPSPTPVTYVVQEGDTPILIANKFGVSVQDLINVNNIDPATMQIGQTLIIPTGPQAAPASNELMASPTPSPFQIQGMNVYRTPVGSLECLGEVYNPGPNALGNVQLQITLLDNANQTLIAVPFYVALDVIPPSQSSPFRLLFTDPPATYSQFGITALRGETVDPASRYAAVKVTSSNGAPSGSQFRVTGEVTNQDQTSASKVRLTVTTYDGQKKVIGYLDTLLSDAPIAPGAVIPFDVVLASSSPDVASFATVVEALKVQ